MGLPPIVLQTIGSLVAILALAGLAWWLKLGGAPRLDSEDAVRRAAGEVEHGFTPVAFACDAEGTSALARDAAGQIVLVRRHGNRFAGRLLTPAARALLDDQTGSHNLVVDPGEAQFGKALLTIPDPGAWAEAINRVRGSQDA